MEVVRFFAWFPEGVTRQNKCMLRCILRRWNLFSDPIGKTIDIVAGSKYLTSLSAQWKRKIEATSAIYLCKLKHASMTTKYGCKNAFNFFFCLYNHGLSFLLTEQDISDYRTVYEAKHPYPTRGPQDYEYEEDEEEVDEYEDEYEDESSGDQSGSGLDSEEISREESSSSGEDDDKQFNSNQTNEVQENNLTTQGSTFKRRMLKHGLGETKNATDGQEDEQLEGFGSGNSSANHSGLLDSNNHTVLSSNVNNSVVNSGVNDGGSSSHSTRELNFQENTTTMVQGNTTTMVQGNTATMVQGNTATMVQGSTSTVVQGNTSTVVQGSTSTVVQGNTMDAVGESTTFRGEASERSSKDTQTSEPPAVKTEPTTGQNSWNPPMTAKQIVSNRKTTSVSSGKIRGHPSTSEGMDASRTKKGLNTGRTDITMVRTVSPIVNDDTPGEDSPESTAGPTSSSLPATTLNATGFNLNDTVSNATNVDNNATNKGTNDTSLGNNCTITGSNATSPGSNASISCSNATSPGNNASISGSNATSPVNNASISGSNATSPGNNASISGSNATSPGNNALISGSNATSPGNNTLISGSNATSPGNNASISGSNATSPGSNGTIEANDSIRSRRHALSTVMNSSNYNQQELKMNRHHNRRVRRKRKRSRKATSNRITPVTTSQGSHKKGSKE
ncbi:hypothetical protein GE061_006912 [Apolygus lucorum]|uniref:Uncharacterized protein n=1 Tax=Apolygus lucorum TaxID=248454 RepID=A0A8S9WRR7_APOLU|nr:hypothetical protein GE061_006912 [Apolygus lucorum]